MKGQKPERGTSGAPRSGLRSLTAVRAEATSVNTDSKGAPLYIASTNHFPIAVVGAKAFPIVQAYGARLGMKPHSPHASSLGKGQDLSEHATAESLAPPIDRRVHAHQVRLLS